MRDRADTARRNLIIRKRLARCWIFDNDSGPGEIAVTQRLRGHLVLNGLPARETEAFIGPEEKRLVLPVVEFGNQYRAAHAGAEIIAHQLRFFQLAKFDGIERAVLVIPEKVAVKGVRSALGYGGDIADFGELGCVADALHFDFRDALERWKCLRERSVTAHVADRDAVHRELRHRLEAALDREVAVVVRLHARQSRNECIRAGASASAAHITGKRHERLAVQARLHGLRVGRDHAGGGLYIDCGRNLADLKTDIYAQCLARDKQEFGGGIRLETLGSHFDLIVTGLGIHKFIIAAPICGSLPSYVLVRIGSLDSRLWHDGSGVVFHAA